MHKADIYLKSGNKIRCEARELKVTRRADNSISELSWDGLVKPKNLMYIRLASIEAVVKIK